MEVQRIASAIGKRFIKEHHYSHGVHNGPMCYGLTDGGSLLGVLAVATPCSENVRRSLFGQPSRVSELHRLVLLDGHSKNAVSWFITRSLRLYHQDRPDVWALISFADTTQGHLGTIYQAVNAIYCGTTGKATFYRDQAGVLRHPRQNGVNITAAMAKERGWTAERRGQKHRYVLPLGGPAARRAAKRDLRISTFPYPKAI